MTIIYFIRHAESDTNIIEDRIRPLTEAGLKNSIKVGELLSDVNIEYLFSSPYKRSVDTIIPLANILNKEIIEIEDFRERKITDIWIEDFEGFSKRQWDDFDYKIEGGESLNEVQNRNIRSLNKILEKYNNSIIAIGTHGTALSTIVNYYNNDFSINDFNRIKSIMPWIVKMEFDNDKFIKYEEIFLDA